MPSMPDTQIFRLTVNYTAADDDGNGYPLAALGAGAFRKIRSIRCVPDMTGATFDSTLWSFIVQCDGGRVMRQVNAANSFTADFSQDTEPAKQIDRIRPYYAGVAIGALIAAFITIEIAAEG